MNLTGHILIAMPGMGDPRFQNAVVLLCQHGEDGAMGLIVNKPSAEVTLAELLEQLDIEAEPAVAGRSVHFGGPVEGGRGFVLHSPDYQSALHTLAVTGDVAMTATLDVLEDIAAGRGPERFQVLLGYAGWGPGQLEGEIAQNGWLTAPCPAGLVFATADAHKWAAALNALGIDPMLLSADAGRA